MTAAARHMREYRKRLRKGLQPARCDIGADVYSTLEYLGWKKPGEEISDADLRVLLTRALALFAKQNNPFL